MGFLNKLFGDDESKVANYQAATQDLQNFYQEQVKIHGKGKVPESADFLRLNAAVNEAAGDVSAARRVIDRIREG